MKTLVDKILKNKANQLSINAKKIGFQSILFVGILFIACEKKHNSDVTLEKFQVVNPVVMDTTYTREYIAEIQSVQNVEIRAKVKGFIDKICIDEGKQVKEGQIIFTISNLEFKEDLRKATAQLNSAKAESKIAEIELKNSKTLFEKNIISQPELDMASAKYEAILARIEEFRSMVSAANINLSFTQIRAPFSGVINRIPYKTGSLIEEGTLLTSISNNNEVFAYFNISETEYLHFMKQKTSNFQKTVQLLRADKQLHPYTGIIETSENEVNKNTGNIAFRARFSNKDQLLKHGSSAKVLIGDNLTNIMVIPQKSTFEIQENTYVYVVDKDNTIQMRNIVTSLRMPNLFVISSGLSKTDRVLYEGIQLVKQGDKIDPQQISINQQASKLAFN